MYIDQDKKFAYIAIPKTGTYSVYDYLGNNTGHPEPLFHHLAADIMVAAYPYTIDFKMMSFVRNPWDKLVSIYHDFTKRRINAYSGHITAPTPLLGEFDSFEDMCMNLGSSPWFHDVFFRPQVSFLTVPGHGLSKMTFVGRFENLDEDLNKACSMFGLPVKDLSKHNIGNYDHGYRKYYTPETREIIGNLYKQDIEAFDYEF